MFYRFVNSNNYKDMKEILFLVVLSTYSFSLIASNSFSQNVKVNLNFENATVREVLLEVKKQTGYSLFYSNEELDDNKLVSVRIDNSTVDNALNIILKNQDLAYSVEDNVILIYNPAKKPTETTQPILPEKIVTGIVFDESENPIIGASVIEKGTANGVITDNEGGFSISVSTDNATLEISYVGFISQSIKIGDQTEYVIILKEDSRILNEIVVVGYGTQKKINLTGAVSMISGQILDDRSSVNISKALQGSMPGVTVIQTSGQPGKDDATIYIRGIGTMNNTAPMILVDGVETSMNDININDIESVSVLKDAASASIYGTKAANGVILITTKRGEEGVARINYNGYFGWQKPTYIPEYLNSAEYARLYNQALANEGMPPQYSEEDIRKYASGEDPVNYPNTDWMDLLFQGSGFQSSHHLGFTGGNRNTVYAVSLGYLDQEGTIKNTLLKRYNFRINLDSDISPFLKIGTSTSLSHKNITTPISSSQGTFSNIIEHAHRIPPTVVNQYPDGSWGRYIDGSPIAWIEEGGREYIARSHLLSSFYAELKLYKGLSLRGMGALDYDLNDVKTHNKSFEYYDGYTQGPNYITDAIQRAYTLTLQSTLHYNESFKKNNVTVLLGIAREQSKTRSNSAYRKNLPNNVLQEIDAGSKDGMQAGGSALETRLGSYFGRINYDYDKKYLFEANLRCDGSSKFSSDNRWGWFPSFSVGWRISEENFMKNASFIDNMKVRLSWGKLGNHRTDDYQYLNRLTLGMDYNFYGSIADGVVQTKSSNPLLGWETTDEWNLGYDMSILSGKLDLSIDLYNKYTSDILINVPISSVYGLPAPVVNKGAMRNKGIEFAVGHRNRIGNDFSYNISANGTFNRNRVEKYQNPTKGSRIYSEGYEWGAIYGYEWLGYYQTDEEAQTEPKIAGSILKAGDIKLKDQNGDGKIDDTDRVVLGSDKPGFTYSLNMGADYKGFDLRLFFQGIQGAKKWMWDRSLFPFYNGAKALKVHLDYWTPENPNAAYPRVLINSAHNRVFSSYMLKDASYLRLKDIQIGYAIPERVVNKIHIKKCRIYVDAENLFTISGFFKDFDPETPAGYQETYYPLSLTYSFGINLTF